MIQVLIAGIMHVNPVETDILYKHDDLGRALYEQNVALGYIVEDLADD